MAKKSSRSDADLNRAALHRIHRIFEHIRSGAFPNKRKLAEELEVNERTIQRDLDFMRDALSLPIEYDPQRYGFWFSRKVGHFPLLKLTEGQLFAIFVGEKALESYVGTPFEGPLRETFRKFAAGLSGELSIEWSELKSAISFKATEVHAGSPEVLQAIILAIRQRRELVFDYRGLKQDQFAQRRVRPYELVLVDHQWYLFAFDLGRQEIRTFVPGRLKQLRTLEATFVRPKGFSASAHIKDSFGVFSGGTPRKIVIHFDRFASQLVRERKWHASQNIVEAEGGTLEMTLTLGSFEELERWILSWGHHAKLLEPPEWVAKLKASLQQCISAY